MTVEMTNGLDLPQEGQIVPLGALSILLSKAPHPVWSAFRQEIEENWQREQLANPALYDGTVLLAGIVRYSLASTVIEVHRARFATLLWWRKNYRLTPFVHAFCMAFPFTTDGKLLAIRMAPHTASPGRIYCAAGTLDENDLIGDVVDYEGNMARELKEETGLEISTVHGLHALRENGRLVIFRAVELGLDSIEAERMIYAHMANDEEKEISGPVFIDGAQNLPESFASFMQPIINWVFEAPATTRMN